MLISYSRARTGLVALISGFSVELPVELPGIEPTAKRHVICGNAESEYAKRRESTRNDLRIRERG